MKKGPRQGRRITQAADGGGGMVKHSTALLWNNDRYDAVLVEEHSDKRMISTWQTVDVKRYYDGVLHHTNDDGERRCGLVSEPSPLSLQKPKRKKEKKNKARNGNVEDYFHKF
jgi:hypothetical protein